MEVKFSTGLVINAFSIVENRNVSEHVSILSITSSELYDLNTVQDEILHSDGDVMVSSGPLFYRFTGYTRIDQLQNFIDETSHGSHIVLSKEN